MAWGRGFFLKKKRHQTNLWNMCQRNITSMKPIRRITHFRNLLPCKLMGPSLRIIGIVFTLPNGRTGDFLWEFRVWFDLVVQGRMLARGFDTTVVVVVVVGGGGGGCGGWRRLLLRMLLGFLGWRIGLTFDRFRSSRVVLRKRGCQTWSHGNGSGSWVEEKKEEGEKAERKERWKDWKMRSMDL